MHKFSIVTPSYNQGHFLEQTITSVLSQEGVDIEYFIMDGGSTDNSVEIIKRYADKLAGWRSGSDDGQSWAINRGLELCTGDVVAYINSDDYYPAGVFQRVSRLFDNPDVDWVAGIVEFVDADGGHIMMQRPRPRDSLVETLVWGVDMGQPGVFLRRSLLERAGLFDENLNYIFDTEYWTRLIKAGNRPMTVSEVFAVRRLHGETKTELSPERFDAERERVRERYAAGFAAAERRALDEQLRRKAVHDDISRAAVQIRCCRPAGALGKIAQAFKSAPWLALEDVGSRMLSRLRGS